MIDRRNHYLKPKYHPTDLLIKSFTGDVAKGQPNTPDITYPYMVEHPFSPFQKYNLYTAMRSLVNKLHDNMSTCQDQSVSISTVPCCGVLFHMRQYGPDKGVCTVPGTSPGSVPNHRLSFVNKLHTKSKPPNYCEAQVIKGGRDNMREDMLNVFSKYSYLIWLMTCCHGRRNSPATNFTLKLQVSDGNKVVKKSCNLVHGINMLLHDFTV